MTAARATAQPAQLPPELLRSVPRQVALTVQGKIAAGFALLLLAGAFVAGLLLYLGATRDAVRFHELQSQSVLTAGEFVQFSSRTKDDSRSVTYSYTVGGQTYTGRARLRRREWRGLQPGSAMVVRYVTTNPAVSWVPGHEPKGVPLWTVAVFPPLMLLASALLAHGLRGQRRLLSEGRAALARVTRSERIHRDKQHAYRVYYEFQILSGATRTGHYDVAKNPPATGVILPVIYDAENPRRSARYPLCLVRTSSW